jgi:hypothetical protein
MSRDIIESGCVGKHGARVKVEWEGGAVEEDGTQEVFRGVSKGNG